MRKLTTTNKIAIMGIIISIILIIGGWFFVDKSNIQNNNNIESVFNQNENKGIINNNINQIANFVLTDKKTIFQDGEYRASLIFEADGALMPSAVCYTVEADAKILEINIEGLAQLFRQATTTNSNSGKGEICLYNPRANMMIWVKFDKQPKEIEGKATNMSQS